LIQISNSQFEIHVHILAARRARVLQESFASKMRAQGKPGARCTRSLACEMKKAHEHRHHRYSRNTRPSLRNGFNGFLRALPGDRACLPPSPPRSLLLKNLTPASGRQDHTTSPSARNVIRLLTLRRPPHPVPTSVTIAIRPSSGTGCRGYRGDLAFGKTEIFFLSGLDTAIAQAGTDLPVGQISHESFWLNRPTREFGHLAPLAGRGRRSPGDANGSRERAPDDRLRIVRRAPGEGDSQRVELAERPLTPTLSPRSAGRGRRDRCCNKSRAD
jgi:hypothetical protein